MNLVVNLAFIGVLALAAVAIVVSLIVVIPGIVRPLIGRPGPDEAQLSRGKRILLALGLALGCLGFLLEGISLIKGDALLSNAGLALIVAALLLLFFAMREVGRNTG